MSLENKVNSELWDAIEQSYGSKNYTHAIKDAMAHLTYVLRDKSGLDGDGDDLANKALVSCQYNIIGLLICIL